MMKKNLIGLLLLVLVAMMLVACDEKAAENLEEKETEEKVVEEPKEEVDEEESEEDVESVEVEQVSTAEKSVDDTLFEYNMEMQPLLTGISNEFMNFSDLMFEMSEDVSVIFTDSWVTDVALTLVTMENYLDDIRAVEPPQEIAHIHDIVVQATDEYQFVIDNLPTAIDTMDLDLLAECTDHIMQGNQYLDQATLELSIYKDNQ